MTFEQQTKETEAEINWLNKLTVRKERQKEMKNKDTEIDNYESRNKVKRNNNNKRNEKQRRYKKK